MTVEKISNVLALSNDVKITPAFESNIWVESCGSYFDTFTKEDNKRMIAPIWISFRPDKLLKWPFTLTEPLFKEQRDENGSLNKVSSEKSFGFFNKTV